MFINEDQEVASEYEWQKGNDAEKIYRCHHDG